MADPYEPSPKRSRADAADAAEEVSCSPRCQGESPAVQCPLLHICEDVLFAAMSWLDSKSLARMQSTCRTLRAHCSRSTVGQLPFIEKAAKESLLRKYSSRPAMAQRWETYSWLQRLRIEEVESDFDIERCAQAGFQFVNNAEGRTEKLKLEGIGPRMLVSRETTGTAPFLRWRLEVRGNNAMELGVVPESLQDSPKALHKCQVSPTNHRPTGVFSSITVGSMLPIRVPLMKGSDIEVLAWSDKLEFLIRQPSDGYEMTWINSTTVPRPYTGPKDFYFKVYIDNTCPMKLALTCWAHAEFVLPSSGPVRDSNNFPAAELMNAAAAFNAAAEAANAAPGQPQQLPHQPFALPPAAAPAAVQMAAAIAAQQQQQAALFGGFDDAPVPAAGQQLQPPQPQPFDFVDALLAQEAAEAQADWPPPAQVQQQPQQPGVAVQGAGDAPQPQPEPAAPAAPAPAGQGAEQGPREAAAGQAAAADQ